MQQQASSYATTHATDPKARLNDEFEMKDLGVAKKILGRKLSTIQNLVNYVLVSEVILDLICMM